MRENIVLVYKINLFLKEDLFLNNFIQRESFKNCLIKTSELKKHEFTEDIYLSFSVTELIDGNNETIQYKEENIKLDLIWCDTYPLILHQPGELSMSYVFYFNIKVYIQRNISP